MTTNTKIEVARYNELPMRIGRKVKIAEENIALFKVTSGEVYAIEDKSPHPKGGVLSEGLVSGDYVFCPVYDWKISLIDGKVQAPDYGQVRTYEVQQEDGKIVIII
ncbi:nitrite reductase small subunit NirD [Aquibacillus rhizosphaerae]|uniref:Nitrite reductase small subunit NirD n=1 Tax=Aquibacillus rhizosphaerae TaxID=3051431 RepID=A0ABT7LCY1_9BACI|nr:nitrite reductase small subunit NirD [Aquibacillus sp. LR5S19]MDL4843035.1 nitrite reductase small subunit NirD [Aquibacillus sp. LR5S19]